MIVTEEYAKAKICHRTLSNPLGISNCLGSNCMAWRWVGNPEDRKPFEVHKNIVSTWKGYKIISEPDENDYVKIQAPDPIEGYCGDAGPV